MTITSPHDIIRRPVVTEKTSIQKKDNAQISFEVSKSSNRIEIKRAVENVFDVKIAKVRTMQIKGKVKRKGRVLGKRRNWKKAMVTLMPGESVDFFEGV